MKWHLILSMAVGIAVFEWEARRVAADSGRDADDRLPAEPAYAAPDDTERSPGREVVEREFVGVSERRSFDGALSDALRQMDKAVRDQGKFPCSLVSWRVVEIRGKSGSPAGLNTLEVKIAASFETRIPQAEDKPARDKNSVREIFRPTTRDSGETSWTSLSPRRLPGELKQHLMIVQAHRDDLWPVTLAGETEPLFRAELIDGDADEVQLKILDADRTETLTLKRDAPRAVRIGDREFRITYATSEVEGDEPAHVDHATILVTLPGSDDTD